MIRRLSAAAALAVALAAIVGTAVLALAVPGPAGPVTLGAIAGLAVLWLAVAAICWAAALRRAADHSRWLQRVAGRPLIHRGEAAAFLRIPEVDR